MVLIHENILWQFYICNNPYSSNPQNVKISFLNSLPPIIHSKRRLKILTYILTRKQGMSKLIP